MNWDETTPPHAPAEAPDDPGANEAMRARLLARFEQKLDEALAAEGPPAGLAPEILAELESDADEADDGECSLHALWSAMTALTQETKLQGRAFKQLNNTLEPLAAETPAVREAQQNAAEQTQRLAESIEKDREERRQEAAREAERQARTEMVEVLIDIRERMARSLDAVRSYIERVQAGRKTARRNPQYESIADAAPSLETGYRLSLDYVNEVLGRLGVREIPCDGKLFDPRLMKATDVEETGQVPEGTVLEVHRVGYEWNGDLFRLAEVKVSRQPPPKPEPESLWARICRKLTAVFRQ